MGKGAVLFVNTLKENASNTAVLIQNELEKKGINAVVFSFNGKPENPPKGEWDIAFSLGGDGTVLYTSRCLSPAGVPILPVNIGSLGFIAGVDNRKWLDVFNKWEKGEISPSRRCMLEISVERASQIAAKNICLNDIVITTGGIAKLINLNVNIYSDKGVTDLASYRCDGLIVSTPTGSTAYSMAAGGPILDPEMEAMILNPICPFTLSNIPFVLPSRQKVVITVADKQKSGVLLTVDGQDVFELERADRIYVQQAVHPALLIYQDMHTYYSALRSKLFRFGDSSGEKNA